MNEFDELIAAAAAQPFAGWDFTYIQDRFHEADPPWSYRQLVTEAMAGVTAMLDMGTGGGEFLSSLAPFPPLTCATEAYPPNIPVARARLEPLGVQVFPIDGDDTLPFADGQFDLVINRHESYSPMELWRIVKPGGRVLTQQVGDTNDNDLNRLLGAPLPTADSPWNLAYAAAQMSAAGFTIAQAEEAFPPVTIYDVGAIVYYLKAIPWQIPDFDAAAYRSQLLTLHQQIQVAGPLRLSSHRFYFIADKPRPGL
ncbi:MAG: class I SAM-dependent methyltransferase [Anaerolineae bacterium]|nr:class I SAM-dependent methyltransferase [Anaerolineae bacterium]